MKRTGRWSGLFRSACGQFTIEASLTMPLILVVTVSLLFVALFWYNQTSLLQAAALSAERAAYAWDNSGKDLQTGEVDAGSNDGLYWRLTNDNLSNLFSFLLPTGAVKVTLPVSGPIPTGSSPTAKLTKSAAWFPPSWRGELQYENGGLLRKIGVDLQRPFTSPASTSRLWNKTSVDADAHAYVTDPMETIRLTDLARTFLAEIKGRIKPREALQSLVEPKTAVKEPVKITNHEQAANYLRTLVGGTKEKVQVSPGTKREIDAFDARGIAHQAYYTFNEKNLREVQMPKDIELLWQGTQVQGVVWHFFKLSKQDKVKLSQGLKQQLERSGIVVILHE
ncbi:hypothetical protein PAESOLCIP111_04961 [Paenibacillus solanacearum]|uniref:Pilus assembly protein n=1 Tax=Paenibacillus solanacearum TaxID=2048548 RepID=A0A916NL02_9BACL|nr:TadE family protein [Paenibacillus solanacearum]CAG7645488.1 hypothetical protein PAESOLCIP111_04961 [Paenibacillus solanacearum]